LIVINIFFSEKQREIIRYWLKSFVAFFIQNDLSKLAKFYGTDKFEHGYTVIYDNYFQAIKNQKLRVLEIGIGGGANIKFGGNSLKVWAKYFKNSQILGIDIYDKTLIDYRRIKTYQGNQSDAIFLSQFTDLDIIIDDGSHINKDIIQSFEFLFSQLNSGGYYCIEDTQVSGVEEYHDAYFPSTLDYFKSIDNTEVGMVQFYEKLVVIKKI
jgi:cephalosporin hydroxylase